MSNDLQKSYDAVAANYTAEFRNELAHKPFDRKIVHEKKQKKQSIDIQVLIWLGVTAPAIHNSQQATN